MSGSEFLVQALEREGVEVVFGFPGGAIMPVYDALYSSKLTHVLVRHEQAAALAKEALVKGVSVRDLAREKNLLDEGQLTKLLDLRRMTEGPGATAPKED